MEDAQARDKVEWHHRREHDAQRLPLEIAPAMWKCSGSEDPMSSVAPPHSAPFRCLHDRHELRAFLGRSTELHVYSIGDLEPAFWERTQWFGLDEAGVLAEVALLWQAPDCPTLLALSETPARMAGLLCALKAALPRRFFAHLSPGAEAGLAQGWRMGPKGRHLKMALHAPDRVAQVADPGSVLLAAADLPAIGRLLAEAYPENWFDPRMLQTGVYRGMWRGERLVGMAGVHVYAPSQRVAALGNICVHPEVRGQGLGGALTAALCRHLLREIETIGLNVDSANLPAIRIYASLGFEVVAPYLEVAVQADEGAA